MTKAVFLDHIAQTNTLTGNKQKSQQLYYQLKKSFAQAERIDIIVSFLMTSGVRLLLSDIKNAIERNVQIRILTGKYLNITQPDAIALLKKEFGEKIDLRFYLSDDQQSFHPKAYIFHKKHGSEIFVGSSNISYSALTSGIEWNYRFNSNQHKADFDFFFHTFEDLFLNHSIIIDDAELNSYAKNYKKSEILKKIEEKNECVIPMYAPRGAQIEALYALQKTRADGANKALIFAATGIGKTYLAAFDSKNYQKVLFVSHQEEILKQAAQSFKNVRNSDDFGFFYAKTHDTKKSVIFASVQTLGKSEYLNADFFANDYFDYIVIDEFHHAVNKQYRSIINYFKPKFLLGLTATPDRADGRNIYEICDYNVPFELSLFQGINRGLLVPFHYYGIFDEIDYSAMRFFKGEYLEEDLNKAYIGNQNRSNLIFKHYKKYNAQKALGFCCSRFHAEYMAEFFCKKGIPAAAVYSNADGEYSENREKAIENLKNGHLRIIFSVNMFNEGVDIPEVDMVLFLRPTQSETVFLQQLGRGLRLFDGKNFLTVLDFIGNYKNAGTFIKKIREEKAISEGRSINEDENFIYPDGCFVDFDLESIDLIAQLKRKSLKTQEIIRNEFFRIKALLSKIPTRTELFANMSDEVFELCLKYPRESPFKNYLAFLKKLDLLNPAENELFDSIAADFLNELEKTNMTKSYKMPVLQAFFKGKYILQTVSDSDLLSAWKNFFSKNENWKDLPSVKNFSEFKLLSDKEHLSNIKKNPVNFLIKSGKGFFIPTARNSIALAQKLSSFLENPEFIAHFQDIINFRTKDYYMRRYREKDEPMYSLPEPEFLMVADSGAEK